MSALAVWVLPDGGVRDAGGRVHRPECAKAQTGGEGVVIAAGVPFTRDLGPGECWTCQPRRELRPVGDGVDPQLLRL